MSSLYTSAPHLFAQTRGLRCTGSYQCYWCTAPCGREYPHGDPLRAQVGLRRNGMARHHSSPFACVGCHQFRRPRLTLRTLTGKLIDGRSPRHYSWFLRDDDGRVVSDRLDGDILYEFLVAPPLRFCLSLITTGVNPLQMAPINENEEVRADTPLYFLLDGTRYTYNVHELEHALAAGDANGTEPGVAAIIRFLGPPIVPPTLAGQKTGQQRKARGRPPKEQSPPNLARRIINDGETA